MTITTRFALVSATQTSGLELYQEDLDYIARNHQYLKKLGKPDAQLGGVSVSQHSLKSLLPDQTIDH
jgi:hypothetical protein